MRREVVLAAISMLFALLAFRSGGYAQNESVIYSFDCPGACFPSAVIADHGRFFGTTAAGGDTIVQYDGVGDGTVFGLTPPPTTGGAWTETVLHRFQGGSDGFIPQAPLLAGRGNVLYGTTQYGGTPGGGPGYGTVFSIRPPASGRGP